MQPVQTHTVVLCQPTRELSSRIYSDYDRTEDSLDGIVQMVCFDGIVVGPKKKN